MNVAEVFQSGSDRAIRLPDEFRMDADEVSLRRTPEGFLVIPRDPWEVFYARLLPNLECGDSLPLSFLILSRDFGKPLRSPELSKNWGTGENKAAINCRSPKNGKSRTTRGSKNCLTGSSAKAAYNLRSSNGIGSHDLESLG